MPTLPPEIDRGDGVGKTCRGFQVAEGCPVDGLSKIIDSVGICGWELSGLLDQFGEAIQPLFEYGLQTRRDPMFLPTVNCTPEVIGLQAYGPRFVIVLERLGAEFSLVADSQHPAIDRGYA